MQLMAFDLLWINGESCLNEPLRVRRERLERLARPAFRLAQITRAHSAEEIERRLPTPASAATKGL